MTDYFSVQQSLISFFFYLQESLYQITYIYTYIAGFHSRDQQPCFSTKTKESVCIIIELNSRRIWSGHQQAAFSLFRGTNMAVVTSCENREYSYILIFNWTLLFLWKKHLSGSNIIMVVTVSLDIGKSRLQNSSNNLVRRKSVL